MLEVALALGATEDDYFLDEKANETRLVQADAAGRPDGARVVLFGTHDLLGVEAGFNWLAEPALVLLPPPGTEPMPITGIPDDPSHVDGGPLTASEAAGLRLSAEWVILSACNTAAGGSPDAEGLSGLARAFLYAGAQALLVSHWPVSDSVGARLVARTVQLSQEGSIDRSDALRQAMTEVMADTSRDLVGQSLLIRPF